MTGSSSTTRIFFTRASVSLEPIERTGPPGPQPRRRLGPGAGGHARATSASHRAGSSATRSSERPDAGSRRRCSSAIGSSSDARGDARPTAARGSDTRASSRRARSASRVSTARVREHDLTGAACDEARRVAGGSAARSYSATMPGAGTPTAGHGASGKPSRRDARARRSRDRGPAARTRTARRRRHERREPIEPGRDPRDRVLQPRVAAAHRLGEPYGDWCSEQPAGEHVVPAAQVARRRARTRRRRGRRARRCAAIVAAIVSVSGARMSSATPRA